MNADKKFRTDTQNDNWNIWDTVFATIVATMLQFL